MTVWWGRAGAARPVPLYTDPEGSDVGPGVGCWNWPGSRMLVVVELGGERAVAERAGGGREPVASRLRRIRPASRAGWSEAATAAPTSAGIASGACPSVGQARPQHVAGGVHPPVDHRSNARVVAGYDPGVMPQTDARALPAAQLQALVSSIVEGQQER